MSNQEKWADLHITTLIENHADAHHTLKSEHGISFLIEYGDTTLLFDTGQSGKFLDNARDLNVDLRTVDHVVISHGHYDHTDGLPFLAGSVTADFTLHVHRDFFDPKYATDGAGDEEPVTYKGCSWTREWAEETLSGLDLITGSGRELVPGLHIVTDFDHPHPLEVKNPRFVVRRPGSTELEVDDFRDEVALVLETEKGLVVLVGCSHPGIMNILDTVAARFSEPIYAVLGGTHLIEAHGERLTAALGYLANGSIGKLGLSHCTGDEAMDTLEKSSSVFYRNVTGTGLEA
jgi:7,8-dihydropterin-6-yl-methyl-4-(beta-D-ribofuranosyl)aminobenzene 5'-phosphate synthase